MFQVECNDVAKYYGKTEVFRNLHFRFEGALCIGVQGPNGSGKSTLLKCLSGLIRPSNGHITWKENEVTVDQRIIRFRMGFAAPYLHLYNELSVQDNLLFLQQLRENLPANTPSESSTQSAGNNVLPDLIDRFGLGTIYNRPFGTLSSGQQQRVRLAGALVSEPPVLMLDEPGSNLDEEGMSIVSGLIKEKKENGCMIFLASNNPGELDQCDEIVSLTAKKRAKTP